MYPKATKCRPVVWWDVAVLIIHFRVLPADTGIKGRCQKDALMLAVYYNPNAARRTGLCDKKYQLFSADSLGCISCCTASILKL
jgi:hypothetical protein